MFLQAGAAINYTTLVSHVLPVMHVLCVAHLQSARAKRGSRVEFANIFAH